MLGSSRGRGRREVRCGSVMSTMGMRKRGMCWGSWWRRRRWRFEEKGNAAHPKPQILNSTSLCRQPEEDEQQSNMVYAIPEKIMFKNYSELGEGELVTRRLIIQLSDTCTG